MTKIAGSYESVVRGVSEQVPQDRRSGQHTAQINMVSDPVRGLARRHGSVMQSETVLPIANVLYPSLISDTANHKTLPFKVEGVEYDLIYRSAPDYFAVGKPGFAFCNSPATNTFVPIVYNTGDATLNELIAGGVSAGVNVGRFIYLAGNIITPTFTASSPWAATDNQQKYVGWVRGGAYSRTFKLILTRPDGSKVTASYKTVSSSYPNLLNTSDLLASDAEYQKKVNDRVNAYNGEVTKWIGTAAADITPENIAQKLAEDLVAQGVTGVSYTGGTVTVFNSAFSEIAGDDGGDGTLIHAVGNELKAVDLVSTIHWVGKIVRIAPKADGAEAIYLRAEPKDKVSTGITEVVWRECAGKVMQPDKVFIMGTVIDGTLYLASTAAALSTLTGLEVPGFAVNEVGDDLSCPLPELFGKKITYLGLFQDRLVIGAGGTILMSRNGDYLNWFRKSVTTIIDTDPCEGYALGAEDDTIRYSTIYDRNLVLYGEKNQYIISGRQPVVPNGFSIMTGTAFEDAVDAAPKASGNYVFYARHSGEAGREITGLHQVQPGIVAESPESYDTSEGLDTYIQGTPVEIVAMTAPNVVLLRTATQRNSLYTYSYLDKANGSERITDSWSRWDWDPAVGSIVGISKYKGGILVYLLRTGKDPAGATKIWFAVERFVRESTLSGYPYADSLRPVSSVTSPPSSGFISGTSDFADRACVVVGGNSEFRFMGEALTNLAAFLANYPADLGNSWVGINCPAYVTPTNPFTTDRNGRAILTGRTTLGSVDISVADTGGLSVDVTRFGTTATVLDFIGRILGQEANLIGRQPVVATNLKATIGGEVRECSYTIRSKKWLPLTVTAIGWVGQYFNNTRRVT
jgi:hypothetical protein